MLGGRRLIAGVVAALSIGLAAAQDVPAPTPAPSPAAVAYTPPVIKIARATGPIVVDGDISDPAWNDAAPIEQWWETNPGDNVPPKVRTVGKVAYDDKYLYVAMEFDDPDPKKIRAPYADRDNVDSTTDYGGIILDADNDRKTAILFLANPRGIQYDSMNSDTNGSEDNAPDWFWDSAGKIGDKGWTLEIRIPFSSLRYSKDKVQTWGMMLYRNYPRDRRYQMFTVRQPRDSSCFICNEQNLEGMTDLPTGGNWVVAPYGVAHQESVPRGDLGTDLVNPAPNYDAGVDAKWAPNASTTLDATYNPDFSQIESDVAQISANERFALFYPEKRPFFLERVDLLGTPIQAVYTRTITDPEWGARATGQAGNTSYTGLVTKDNGGGTVIIPGPNGSDFADQDFSSYVGIGRVRQDFGQSFLSGLLTDREIVGGGYNRVFGPDFQWRPKPSETLTGQFLFSDTITPDTGLATEWDGRRLQSHAADVWYQHQDKHWDGYAEYRDFGDDFRADVGFVPQVGFREQYVEGGYTRRPTKGFVSRQRFFVQGDYVQNRDRDLLDRFLTVGTGIDGLANSFMQFRLIDEDVRAIDALTGEERVLPRQRVTWVLQASPWSWMTRINLDGTYGKEVDFARARNGHGGTVNFNTTLRPSDHIQIDLLANRRWLDVEDGANEPRLFTAQVQRIRAVYTFNRRSFVRLIGQRTTNRRDPAVFFAPDPPDPAFQAKLENIDWSALFAYKLNWQSVLYFGVSDSSEYSGATTDMEHAGRSIFMKVSYAFQH